MIKEKAALEMGDYSLVVAQLDSGSAKKETVRRSIHHLFIIDCSGSMYYELSNIREDLKEKIKSLMQPSDMISIIWFSGRKEFGAVVEGYSISGENSISQLYGMMDRNLVPRGLTAFKDPLVEAKAMIDRVAQSNGDALHSLFFITDGADNCYSQKEILSAVSEIREKVVRGTFVEYGYYCNKKLITEMSMEIGGVHVFSRDFNDYEPYIQKQFLEQVRSVRTKVEFPSVYNGIVFAQSGDDILVFKLDENGCAYIDVDSIDSAYYVAPTYSVGDSTLKIFGLTPSSISEPIENELLRAAYMAMYAFSKKGDYAMVSKLLRSTGDAYYIKKKANTFGSQKINELEMEFQQVVNELSFAYKEGYNPDLEPKEDAYCVMDMLDDLMSDDENKWYPLDPNFQYKRIGRKALLSGNKLNDDEKDDVKLLVESGDISNAIEKLKALEENKKNNEVKFNYYDKSEGYPISNLVWNNSRANLSVQVAFKGLVELPKNTYGLPEKFDTVQFRNYTIIKDGIINTYRLPVSISITTFNKLQANGLLSGEIYESGKVYVLDFSELPVINQLMVKEMKADKLFRDQYALMKSQAKNSVFNHIRKDIFGKVSKDFIETYGIDAAAWLKELGITANGFAPKTTLAESTEEIVVPTFGVKIEKMASVPSGKKDYESTISKLDKGQEPTPREKLLIPAIKEYRDFEKTISSLSPEEKKVAIGDWIDEKSREARKEKTRLMNEISKAQFVTIVGKAWFNDLDGRDDVERVINVDGEDRKFTIEDKLETVKV